MIDPALAGDIGDGDQVFGHGPKICRDGDLLRGERPDLLHVWGFTVGPFVDRCTTAKYKAFCRKHGFFRSIHKEPKHAVIGHFSDLRAGQVPFIEDLLYFSLSAFLDDHQHALLAFAEQQFPGLHVLLALGDLVEINAHAHTALSAGFGGGADDAGGPHVLHADKCTGRDHFQAGLQQFLLLEGVPHLNGGQVLGAVFRDISGSKGGAADSVLAGGGAHDEYRISLPFGCGADGFTHFHNAYTHSVYERVGMIAGFEINFSANGRHTETVTIMADAMHDPADEVLCLGVLEISETQ